MESYEILDDGCLSFAYRDTPCIQNVELPTGLIGKISRVDLTESNVKDLTGLSVFSSLDSLVLDKNELMDLNTCPSIPTLKTLWVNNNNICDLVSFMDEVVNKFPNLEYISMMRNPCSPGLMDLSSPDVDAIRFYRLYVIFRLPGIRIIDWQEIQDAERKESALRGQYAVKRSIVKKTDSNPTTLLNESESKDNNSDMTAPLEPTKNPKLVVSNKRESEPVGKKGESKNSEGNRFIRNSQL